MKKLFAASLLFLGLISISMTTGSQNDEIDYEVDFTKYEKLGFMITPGDYIGKYQGIKYIGTVVYQNIKEKLERTDNPNDYDFSYKCYWQRLKAQTLVDTLYKRARILGADALVNFNIERINKIRLFTATRLPAMS